MQQNPPLSLSSGDLIADRRYEMAMDLAARGDVPAAIDVLTQTLERVPGYASAWFSLAELREKSGDRDGAIAAFRNARDNDPEDRHGCDLHLAILGARKAAEMPRAYVRALFDHYAPAFDLALTGGLQYRAPELLRQKVEAARVRDAKNAPFASMLDLGCGTGLAGEAFRSLVTRLTGVDLSDGMIAQARRKKIYDRLEVADVGDFLAGEERIYDLVAAADVFVYMQDLLPLTQAIARVLKPKGLFAFTVETHDGEGVILRETLRYAHSAAYLANILATANFKTLAHEAVSTRTEKSKPVSGLLVVATAP